MMTKSNKIYKQDMESYIEDIMSRYKVIKEFDFKEDIDQSKSDRYVVNEKTGELEFLYKEVYRPTEEDYLTILGETYFKEDEVRLKLTENEIFGNKAFRNQIILKKSFSKGIIDIGFSKEENLIFSIALANRKYYEKVREMKEQGLSYSKELFESSGSRRMSAAFNNRKLSSYCFKNEQILDNSAVIIPIKENTNELRIDLERKMIFVDGKNIDRCDIDLMAGEEYFIGISCYSNKEIYPLQQPCIKYIKYGEKQGYIYLKPFQCEIESVRLFTLYNGSLALEYYDGVNWLEMNGNEKIEKQKNLCLRIRVTSSSRVYALLVLKD